MVSLTLNILALDSIFVTVQLVGSIKQIVSIPNSCALLWANLMKLGAVLIFCFSCCFPFVKLCSLMYIYLLPGHTRCVEVYMTILNQIGRYSLMDIDVAVALVILSYDQRGALDTVVY